MAVDLTYKRNFAQKKSLSVSAGVLDKKDFSGTKELDLFNIPESALIRDIYIVTEVAGNTGLTFKVKTGTVSSIAAGDVDNIGVVTTSPNIATGSGKKITITPNKAVSAGKFAIIVEYLEYTLGNGILTQYNPE